MIGTVTFIQKGKQVDVIPKKIINKQMIRKFDSTALGTILGIIAPLISFLLILKFVYPFEYSDKSLRSFWMFIMAPKIISLGALPNLGLFMLFIYTNRLKSARGVLGATILLAIIVFVLKLA